MRTADENPIAVQKSLPQISLKVCAHLQGYNLFPQLEQHLMEVETGDNHLGALNKVISHKYLTIRLHHWAKVYSEKQIGTKLRHHLTKAILFQHE